MADQERKPDEPDGTDLLDDLEVRDREEADAVQGGKTNPLIGGNLKAPPKGL